MKSEEQRKQQRDERRASKVPKYWYLPFTWVPPKVEKTIDKNGKEYVRIKQRGYFKMTNEKGTVFKSDGREYEVQANGSLKRKDIDRAKRRQDRNRPHSQGKV